MTDVWRNGSRAWVLDRWVSTVGSSEAAMASRRAML
jgi:hypothetical protein